MTELDHSAARSTRLDIEGTHNFREVVAVTANGATLRAGRLFRSDGLSRLTDRGRAALAELGIRRVIDMRAPEEVAWAPDALEGLGVDVVFLPMLDGETVRDTSGLDLRAIYRRILSVHGEQLAAAIRRVADAEGPVVVHCTAGKDRTGLVIALILLALGVDLAAVVADYAVTEENLAGAWVEGIVARIRAHGVEVTETMLEVLATSPDDVLYDTVDWIEEQYGSVGDYLAGIGIGPDEIGALRSALVAE